MPNPLNLSTLEADLEALAKPNGTGTADATPLLIAASLLLTSLFHVAGIGTAIESVATAIGSALDDAAAALEKIATQLSSLLESANGDITKVAALLGSLQNALATAQTLIPGGQEVTGALQSGSQFFGMLQSLLSGLPSGVNAPTELNKIAQELRVIGTALSTQPGP